MALVVGIHGAFHELWGPHQIESRWLPALRDGLRHMGLGIGADRFAVAFYGDVFRPTVEQGRPDDTELVDIADRSGLTEVVEAALGPGGLDILAKQIGLESLKRTVHQLGRYFAEPDVRVEVLGRLEAVVTPDTRVVVAHSMGTIVAYEALAAHPEWPVTALVTLGSPLGGDFVFPHLTPAPVDGVGRWPGPVESWTNVAAIDDDIVRQPRLAHCFGERVVDVAVDNGHRAHDAEPYLNAPVTGSAIGAGMSG